MGDIIIEKTNYKAFLAIISSLFLLIACAAVTVYGFREDKMRFWFPGMIAAAAFLIGLITSIAGAMKVKSLITITRDGIIDNSSISGVGYVSFDDIKEFIIITVSGKKSIAIIPKNVDSFLSKLNVVKRGLAKRNINADLPPVTIPVGLAKDMEAEDILTLLKKRLIDYSSLYE